jgi:ABC-type phosphate transport system permease subunit
MFRVKRNGVSMNSKLLKENFIKGVLLACAISSICIVFFIVIFLADNGYSAVIDWLTHGFNSLYNFNMVAYMFDSLYLALGGTLLAIAVGIPCAIYLAEFADNKIRNIIKPTLEVLNGFPSVVIGFLGFIILCKNLNSFGISAAQCSLVGWIVLGVMSLPLVTSVSEDSLRAVPGDLREASLGIGATKWQTTTRILISSASSGIITAIVLSFANAIGETMAIIWVIGPAFPPPLSLNPLIQTNSLTAMIAGTATRDTFSPGTLTYSEVFGAAIILFAITALTNLAIRTIASNRNKTGAGTPRKR